MEKLFAFNGSQVEKIYLETGTMNTVDIPK